MIFFWGKKIALFKYFELKAGCTKRKFKIWHICCLIHYS
jgi:hypothetical protein